MKTIIRMTTVPDECDFSSRPSDSITIGTNVRVLYSDRYVILKGDDLDFVLLRKNVKRLEMEIKN